MINQPSEYNFIPHYKGDGLKSFTIQLKYKSGNFVDLTGASVAMQLRKYNNKKIEWEFNSKDCADALIEIIDPLNGIMEFPGIDKWDIDATVYNYDLQVTDKDGFVRTYLRGKWAVNQDITYKEC